jgi:hypothetical protein
MHDHHPEEPSPRRAKELLAAGAEAERRLLKQERKAEKRLAQVRQTVAEDEARVLRAQRRLEESRAALAEAEDALRECQAHRAAGPV